MPSSHKGKRNTVEENRSNWAAAAKRVEGRFWGMEAEGMEQGMEVMT